MLKTTDHSIQRIALEVDFGAGVTFRQQFRRRLRTTPSAYRARFGTAAR